MLPLYTRSSWRIALYGCAFALLSCAHTPKTATAKDKSSAKTFRAEPLSRLNFCEQIGKDISSIGEGFECLASPNWIESGVYGPKSFPNESTLEGQFGQLPEYVFSQSPNPFNSSLKATETFSMNGDLNVTLNQLAEFLPNSKLKTQSGATVNIEISLRDIKLIKVHNIDKALSEKLKNNASTEDATRVIQKLCKDDYVISVASLAALPVVTIKSDSEVAIDSALDIKSALGVTFQMEKKSTQEIVLSANESLIIGAQLRPSKPIVEDLCQSMRSVWYRDQDSDGRGDPSTAKEVFAYQSTPEGYSNNALDCYDQNQNVTPSQGAFFSSHRGDGKFDYNCDNVEEKRWTQAVSSCGALVKCNTQEGWAGEVPECHQEGQWLQCKENYQVASLVNEPCVREARHQECR